MPIFPSDYKVRPRPPQDIELLAKEWRQVAPRISKSQHRVDIIEFVQKTLPAYLKTNFTLEVHSHKDGPQKYEAWISFRPLSLNVAESIWRGAKRGDPHSIFVLAHEVAHLIMHGEVYERNTAHGFSADEAGHLRSIDPNESAEKQANLFADFFLVPSATARQYPEDYMLSALFNISEETALRRLSDLDLLGNRVKKAHSYSGEICPNCCYLTVTRNGTTLVCKTCNITYSPYGP